MLSVTVVRQRGSVLHKPRLRYINFRHDLHSNADKHNPSSQVNSSITNTTQSIMAEQHPLDVVQFQLL